MRVPVLVACALALGLCGGCATIVDGGGQQQLSVRSTPSSGKVSIYKLEGDKQAVVMGTTPCTLSVKTGDGWFKGAKYKMVVEKPGYKSVEYTLEPTVRGWYIVGNFFIGGLVGYVIVDPITGAMWKYAPESYDSSMVQASADADNTMRLHVMFRQDVTPEMEKHLVAIK